MLSRRMPIAQPPSTWIAVVVGAAMADLVAHGPYARDVRRSFPKIISGDSAHCIPDYRRRMTSAAGASLKEEMRLRYR